MDTHPCQGSRKGAGNVENWKRNPSVPQQQTKALRPPSSSGGQCSSPAAKTGGSLESFFIVWVIVASLGVGHRRCKGNWKAA